VDRSGAKEGRGTRVSFRFRKQPHGQMGGSDDERVWEEKMDRRQRKVKGVEAYIIDSN
jgi:hypothetical protein